MSQEGHSLPTHHKVYSNWSYAARQSKLQLKFKPNQCLLTNYYLFIKRVAEIVEGIMAPSTSTVPKINKVEDFSTSLFCQMLSTAYENCKCVPQARRHNEIMKKFSLPVLLRIGSSGYQLLHKNMPEAFPSLSTVKREAAKQLTPLSEGEFAFDKLAAHLEAYNASKFVSISEDATRVIARV